MSASQMIRNPLADQVRALTALVERSQREVGEWRRDNEALRCEIEALRQEVRDLRRESGYWKRQHARAVQRNTKLQAELDAAHAEIRQLKAERSG